MITLSTANELAAGMLTRGLAGPGAVTSGYAIAVDRSSSISHVVRLGSRDKTRRLSNCHGRLNSDTISRLSIEKTALAHTSFLANLMVLEERRRARKSMSVEDRLRYVWKIVSSTIGIVQTIIIIITIISLRLDDEAVRVAVAWLRPLCATSMPRRYPRGCPWAT